jgi:hypothetical protein
MKTKMVCNSCGADWIQGHNPGDCPSCGKTSFGVVVKAQASPVDMIIGAPVNVAGSAPNSFWQKIL